MRPAPFAALAGLLIAAVYGRALGFPFVYDDRVLLEGSPRLGELSTLPTALTRDLFYLAGDVRNSPYWRPVVTLSYYVDHAIGGGAPWSFHLTNLVAMLAATLGVYGLVRARCWPLALLFALWPTQVEGACNVAGRTDVLCAAFAAFALQARSPLAVACLAFAACGSKEVGVLVPLACVALGRPWRGAALGVALYLVGRSWVMAHTPLLAEDQVAPDLASVWGAGHRMAWWLGRLLMPLPLSPALDLHPPGNLAAAAGWLVVALGVGLVWRHRSPERLAGLVLLLGALVPVSGLLTRNVRVGDTLLVLPLVGAVLLAQARARMAPILGLALVGALAGAARVGDWSSERTLWERAHARVPDDPQVRLNYARAVAADDPTLVISLLEPVQFADRRGREVEATRAGAYLQLGREDDAMRALRGAVRLGDPEAAWANAMACVLGVSRGEAGLLPICEDAAGRSPPDPNVLNALGIALMQAGRGGEGEAAFAAAVALAPSDAGFRANLDRARRANQALQR